MSKWSFVLFLHFFLLFFHPHASHQVTINASTQTLTFVHNIRPKKKKRIIVQIFSSLGRMCLCFLRPIFLLPSACSTLLISSLKKRHGWHEDFGDKLIRMCLDTTYFAENWKIYLKSAYFAETKNFLLKVL